MVGSGNMQGTEVVSNKKARTGDNVPSFLFKV